MDTHWGRWFGVFSVALILAVFGGSGLIQAAGEEPNYRQQALALNDITGDKPINGKFKELIEQPAESKKLLAAAVGMAKEKDQPFSYFAALILGRTAEKLGEFDSSQVFYRICIDQAKKLKSPHKLGEAYLRLIVLLYDNKKFEESNKVCQEVLELGGDEDMQLGMGRIKAIVFERMILGLAQQGQAKKALTIVDNLLKNKPEDLGGLDLKATVLKADGQYEAAAKIYEDMLSIIDNAKELKKDEKAKLVDDVRYLLSSVYIDLDQVDKASEQLQTLLADHPDHPTYNNDLGYIWADHDMKLEESEKLIRKALEEDRKTRKKDPDLKPEEDKDSAAYLDSLGWVLFKQKKYKEAKEPLLKAVQDKSGQHMEIFDHLGDVHQALGEKDEATTAWKKALELGGTTKRDQTRKAQLEKKLGSSK